MFSDGEDTASLVSFDEWADAANIQTAPTAWHTAFARMRRFEGGEQC